jgi:hypothetical protein
MQLSLLNQPAQPAQIAPKSPEFRSKRFAGAILVSIAMTRSISV